MPTPTPLSSQSLTNFNYDSHIKGEVSFLADGAFFTAAERWINSEYCRALDEVMPWFIERYGLEDSDCDDFAEVATVIAKLEHRRTMKKMIALGQLSLKERPALAVFNFWYLMNKNENMAHAIQRFVVRPRPGQMALKNIFVEPQPPAHVVYLTTGEIETCLLNK